MHGLHHSREWWAWGQREAQPLKLEGKILSSPADHRSSVCKQPVWANLVPWTLPVLPQVPGILLAKTPVGVCAATYHLLGPGV